MVSYTKYIGTAGTATLLLLIAWFVGSTHFLVEYEGDKTCAGTYLDPCEWNYNITLVTIQTYYIQNKDSVNLVFLPEVKEVYHCKKDGRMTASWRADRSLAPCGIGWREFDWKTPLTSKYKYINKFYKNKKQEFKIVVFKFNPTDKIKFGGEITKDEFDPYFLPIELEYNIIQKCKIRTIYDKCNKTVIQYVNHTFINNITGINESKQKIRESIRYYDCNPHEVEYDCITLGIETDEIKMYCPINHKCNVIGEEFCILDCSDGDCNYNAKQHLELGWSRTCISIKDLKQDTEIRISDFKKSYVKVEKLVTEIEEI